MAVLGPWGEDTGEDTGVAMCDTRIMLAPWRWEVFGQGASCLLIISAFLSLWVLFSSAVFFCLFRGVLSLSLSLSPSHVLVNCSLLVLLVCTIFGFFPSLSLSLYLVLSPGIVSSS